MVTLGLKIQVVLFIKKSLTLFLLFILPAFVYTQKATVSGYIKDKTSGETLIGASIVFVSTGQGVTSNTYGFYSLTGEKAKVQVKIMYIGYVTQVLDVDLSKGDVQLNIELETKATETNEVVIVGEKKDENTESTKMGQIELKGEEIKKVPVLFGESDVIKVIQLLPGVKTSTEGNGSFYVRGGGPDQNLIMLDNTVVYNASHLLGFFSIFNSDAIKNVNLIKGGMPANYGGRLSSVLDITMKDGNMKKFHGEGGIGLISTRFTLEGPIWKDRISFIASARRTYLDLFFPLLDERLKGNQIYFYDINAKLNFVIGKKDRIFVSGYYGQDVFRFRTQGVSGIEIAIPWGNAIAAVRWNRQWHSKVFSNVTFNFSDYNYSTEASSPNFGFKLSSGIRDYSLKSTVDWIPSIRHAVKFGVDYTFHTFTPSTASAQFGDSTLLEGKPQNLYSHDVAVFVMDEFSLGSRVKINAGLRFNYFQHFGPFSRYNKNEFGTITDTVVYKDLEKIQDYARLEPRISARFKIKDNISIKAAYTLNFQNLHLANLASVSLPTDVWLPSTSIIKPQEAHQWNLGYFHNLFDNKLEISVEGYYKHMLNLVEYKDNTSFLALVNDNPDNVLTFGKGRSFGVELFVKGNIDFKIGKHPQKISGWVGYTLAWTQRYDFNRNDITYDGEFFYPRYDRRHDIAITFNWDIGKRWSVAAVFVYGTGNALAVPTQFYLVGTNLVPYFEDRDNFRMAPNHRLDLSATYVLHKGKKWEHSLNLSIYNVYSRQNPFFVFFDINNVNGGVKFVGKQIALFPIIPAITWNFKF